MKSVLMRHTVYFKQGYLRNGKGEVAVKKLLIKEHFLDKIFEYELACLKRVKHENIVRLLSYCSGATQIPGEYNGATVPAERLERVLCFEYVPKTLHDYFKGITATVIYVLVSLPCILVYCNHLRMSILLFFSYFREEEPKSINITHLFLSVVIVTLTDASRRHEWDKHYQLIQGICQGLRHLHNEQQIIHLDLKPENIGLDGTVPKIAADFGVSRFIGGKQSRIITRNIYGTL